MNLAHGIKPILLKHKFSKFTDHHDHVSISIGLTWFFCGWRFERAVRHAWTASIMKLLSADNSGPNKIAFPATSEFSRPKIRQQSKRTERDIRVYILYIGIERERERETTTSNEKPQSQWEESSEFSSQANKFTMPFSYNIKVERNLQGRFWAPPPRTGGPNRLCPKHRALILIDTVFE